MFHKYVGNENKVLASFIFAHGELETIFNHDLLTVDSKEEKESIKCGIYPVTIDGYECIAYIWKANYRKGLICLKTDKTANEYAKKKYDTKDFMI